MPEWQAWPVERDDDPYHSWAYERARLDKQTNGTSSAQVVTLCPVVLTALAPNNLTAELYKTLLWIGEQLHNNTFKMPDYDYQHLIRVRLGLRERLEELGVLTVDGDEEIFDLDQDQELPTGREYLRLFLVYAEEIKLFPEADRDLGPDFEKHVRIEYTGRAIRDIVTGDDNKRAMPNAETGIPYDTCLAVIDDSFAFLNEELLSKQGNDGNVLKKSRFKKIWFQEKEFIHSTGELLNGPRISGDDLDDLIKFAANTTEAEAYQRGIEIVDGPSFRALEFSKERHQPLAFPVSHGTHVASTALREFDRQNVMRGSAELDHSKKLALFGVTVPVDVTQDTSGSALGSYLLAALRQVMLWADELAESQSAEAQPEVRLASVEGNQSDGGQSVYYPPLVINFSYGFIAGPKDGSGKLNQVIERMIDSRNALGRPTALGVPMGNDYRSRGVASKFLDDDGVLELDWVVLPDDRTSSFAEFFASPVAGVGNANFTLTLTGPGMVEKEIRVDGTAVGEGSFLCSANRPIATLGDWTSDRATGSRRAFIGLAPTTEMEAGHAPAGRWRIKVTNTSGTKIGVTAFVQRDDTPGTFPVSGRQSYFDAPDSWDAPGTYALADELFGPEATLSHERTANVFASNSSQYVFAVGASMGPYGDDESTPGADRPSPYASAGPRGNGRIGPDWSAMADRSRAFPGIYRAGTYSGAPQRMNGSSVSAPVLAGFLAARPEKINTLAAGETRHQDQANRRFKPPQ